MPEHQTPLIATIVIGLALAFALGLLAQRIRVSPLLGYLLAGVAIGSFTPGDVADSALAAELAEIGIILLMFAVGLHFSWRDLIAVGAIAIPGAVAQICAATLLGLGLALLFGWSVQAGLVFGLALSVASTVVLVRALRERRIIDTERGRIAVGWLVVEDLAMVIALLLLPALAGANMAGSLARGNLGLALLLTFGKVALFFAAMLIVGRRAIPALLHHVAHTGSRELFRLAVLVVALGVAFGAAKLFDVSFALGAFFAGLVLSESRLSQRAAEEVLPLRDAFAVLFFVSVGMLFDPGVILRDPLGVAATVLIIVFGKSAAAYGIVRLFGHGHATALTVSASLAQIGEFSFILAGLGVSLALLPAEGRDLVLAGAILSILLNPLAFWLADRSLANAPRSPVPAPAPAPPLSQGHEVVIGYGRVGGLVGRRLAAAGRSVVVVETDAERAEVARRDGARAILGNAADPEVLAGTDLAAARRLFVAISDAFEAGQVVEQARAARPDLEIIARADSEEAVAHLTKLGASLAIMGEREIAHRMLERALGRAAAQGAKM
jgi:CPA2 family monovalent cation:H+ antiporter-2